MRILTLSAGRRAPMLWLLPVLLCQSSFAQSSPNEEEACFRFFIESQYDSIAKHQSSISNKALYDFYHAQTLLPDSTAYLAASKQALTRANEFKCDECIALHYLSMGRAYRNWQQFPKAVSYFRKGISALPENDDRRTKQISTALNAGLANTYHQLGEFSTALQYGLDALRLAESLNDAVLKIQVYTPLSTIYADLSSPNNKLGTQQDRDRYKSLAKRYMLLSYTNSLTPGDQRAAGTSAYNLGIFYNDENQLDSSNWFLKKAIAHGTASSNNELLSSAYNIMAINYSDVKTDSALLLIDQSINYASDARLIRHQASAMLSKANLLAMSGRIQPAIEQAEQALELCLQSKRKVSILNAYKILSELNEEGGNVSKAYYYYQKHIAIKDSLVSEDNYAEIEELKMKYDVELKDQELQQRNVLISSLAGFIVLGGLAALLFVRQRTLKQKQAIMEAEQRLNRARMNPHFFFNALTSLQNYALTNDGLTMASRLAQFSEVMRKTLESTYQEYIKVEEEVDFLDRYLIIQKDRDPTSFDYKIEIEQSVDVEMLIPPMIIQPFVENSIEHGFPGLDRKGILVIRFKETDNELQIMVIDNGRGLDPSKSASEHISRATQIIRDRLYLLGARVKSNARFDIGKNPDGNGVIVSIFLPKLFQK